MQAVALKLMVVAMMLAVGVELTPSDLAEGPRRTGAFVLALLVNLLLYPALVVGLTVLLGLSAGITAGVVLVAAAPGGPTGTLYSLWARAHVGFATALMVTLALCALVSAPLTVLLVLGAEGGGTQVALPMLGTLLTFQVLPLGVAMAVRRWAPTVAGKAAAPLRLIANGLLGIIVLALVITRYDALFAISAWTHLALGGLVALSLVPAFLDRWLGGLGIARAAGLVTSVRNLSVSLMLSATYFSDPATDMAILAWGVWMMALPAGAAWWLGRRERRRSGSELRPVG